MNQWETLKNAFEKGGFSFRAFKNKEEVKAYLKTQATGKTVTLGGSMTLTELDVFNLLSPLATVHSHSHEIGDYFQTPDLYIASANALTKNGEIVNLDGRGNRVSATIYGPKAVILVCGINKITENLAEAIDRTRNIAAPKNAQRLGRKTPCAEKGDRCYNCTSPERICKALVTLLGKPLGMDSFEILLVEEPLGY